MADPGEPRNPAGQSATLRVVHVAALVALGGAVGAWLRHLAPVTGDLAAIPWATAAVNVGGSLLLGLLVGRLAAGQAPPWVRPTLGTGVLGGFTTFSTFAVESVQRVPGHGEVAAAYAGLTVVGAIAAAGLGLAAGQALRSVPMRRGGRA